MVVLVVVTVVVMVVVCEVVMTVGTAVVLNLASCQFVSKGADANKLLLFVSAATVLALGHSIERYACFPALRWDRRVWLFQLRDPSFVVYTAPLN